MGVGGRLLGDGLRAVRRLHGPRKKQRHWIPDQVGDDRRKAGVSDYAPPVLSIVEGLIRLRGLRVTQNAMMMT